MSARILGYSKIDSPIHNLTGASKMLFFILWSVASMITYDTRLLVILLVLGVTIFKISTVEFRSISFIFYFIVAFMLLNNIAIFILAPYQGTAVYGTRHDLLHIAGAYFFTKEQLFYQFNIIVKYLTVIPVALLFIVTTDPSEFAASLNKLGVSYRIAYAVSITLRYIPDVQNDYIDISFAQQSRGIDMSRNEKFTRRIKNSAAILMPLIFSTLQRIETISCAMELRGFGNKKKRTWYNYRKFEKKDYLAIFLAVVILATSAFLMIYNRGRFYNPFK
ncbi:energy-coupling factor transporter transmembrane protein EcfT [Clostridium sp. 19966]|uniref:energy-coupling factor transporter transmembrane component T family protein n=1 Tax=Clostridium sp. 19966 TaxID=2768166 RepID=UPI0028DFF87C|nr:energy-coupling factor transporter transmembrane component T [Clostridium sp. 19966]MDT8718352.1 energy-coupling factor transporter transmembrane protein EcfT [Clostridium sp. 19966]